MKPPVTIDNLSEEWLTDSSVDTTDPTRELSRIPNLHSKYLNILSHHNLIVKKLSYEYNTLKKVKIEYYMGDLNNPEDLKQYGWEPQMKKIMRQDMPSYLDSDDDLNKILIKKVIHQEIVDYCDRVLKELNNRTFQLSNIIKWEMYLNGRG
jgi:hypothetical protein